MAFISEEIKLHPFMAVRLIWEFKKRTDAAAEMGRTDSKGGREVSVPQCRYLVLHECMLEGAANRLHDCLFNTI